MHARSHGATLVALALCVACSSDADQPDPREANSGGDVTVFDDTRDAFSRPAPALDGERSGNFFVGDSFFTDNWVTAPASTDSRDGLGPLYNARSCATCHFKDGRGRPADAGQPMIQLLVRLSVPGEDAHGGPKPEPTYGGQLNPRAIEGVTGEGDAAIRWVAVPGRYGDGSSYELRRPELSFENLGYGPMSSDVLTSARVAPGVYGLGLIEAVDEATIMAWADPDDRDGDGISGRANRVYDAASGQTVLGRFGWKANQPSLRQQNAGAFLGDIGITTPLFGEENCSAAQADCKAATSGGMPEATTLILDRVTFYTRMLAVPGRRDVDNPDVLRGRALFREARCDACHRPSMTTGTLADAPELSKQTIWPYTDVLLHDMGDDLADGRPDFLADGREWRTPPLWGLGLVQRVNRHDNLLHDGRARGFAEAILWHGGEGEAAREAFRTMSAEDRAALVRFLESL
ncbi:MAG: thiol oxidoreductase [Myxococcales bacterium]|nr:thiol oxidoreductase [Myxococcales bacterium]